MLRDRHDREVAALVRHHFFAFAEEVLKALEPFSDVDGEDDTDFPDDTKVIVQFGRTTYYSLRLADFRRARIAYNSILDGIESVSKPTDAVDDRTAGASGR